MYAEFFGLRELPFNNTPDPRYFFSTPDHEEALASLIYAVKERKGFVLLTGEVGAGKTLVTRLMLRHFGGGIAFANINHAVQSARDLMESVCTEFELPFDSGASNVQLVRTLHDFLLAKFSQNVPVVLILDEAQNLPVEAFEQLRMIGNLEADDAKLLQIAIVGQPELQRLFQSMQLRQLRQRIFRSFHLPALNRKSTEGYIRYRLSVAAARDLDVFTPTAIDRIFAFSSGLPRLINAVCDNAMLSAYSSDRRRIDADFIQSVVSQMMPVADTHAVHAGGIAAAAVASGRGQVGAIGSSNPPLSPLGKGGGAARTASIAAAQHGGAALGHAAPPNTPVSTRGKGGGTDPPLSSPDKGGIATAEAAAVHASLDRLSKRACQIIVQGEGVARDLQRREERVRDLSRSVNSAAGQLCDLLIRLQAASADCQRERRAAVEVGGRLAAETRDSRRVLDELARRRAASGQWSVTSTGEGASPISSGQASGRRDEERDQGVKGSRDRGARDTKQDGTKTVAERGSDRPMEEKLKARRPAAPRVLTTATTSASAVSVAPTTPQTDELQRMLRETQESLATLRRMARPAGATA